MKSRKSTSRRRPRKRICPPAPERSERMYIRIEPSRIGLFRFLLEGYDNLGIFTVTNKFKGILQLRYSPHQKREMQRFLEAVRTEMVVETVDSPLQGSRALKEAGKGEKPFLSKRQTAS